MKEIFKKNFLSPSRHLQIIRWWLPALINQLKVNHQAIVLHYKKLNFSVKHPYLVFRNSATAFPLKIKQFKNSIHSGENLKVYTLGFLIIMQALSEESTKQTKKIIDDYLQKMVVAIDPPVRTISIDPPVVVGQRSILLVQKSTKEEIFKKAFSLYLKSNCLAFFLSSELQWKVGMFQKLTDGFVLIPSYKELSNSQRGLLKNSLMGTRASCTIALGKLPGEAIPSNFLQSLV